MPRTRIERFLVPVVDVHSHPYAETPVQIAEWVALMDRIGVRETLILTGETGAKFRELVARYARAHPGRFAMGAGMVADGVERADYGERLRQAVRADVAAGAVALGELTDKGRGLAHEGAYFIDDPASTRSGTRPAASGSRVRPHRRAGGVLRARTGRTTSPLRQLVAPRKGSDSPQ